jgi:hypothetical protein
MMGINFTTDAWTSPNHRAYIALCIHLEQKGRPFSMVLDIIEVAEVSLSLTAASIAEVLEEFQIKEKVSMINSQNKSLSCSRY